MTVGDMIKTLRTRPYERVEIRDDVGNEIYTCPVTSELLKLFDDYVVIEWFPHGAPNKDATFTVCVRKGEKKCG